jgi:hypothetical protein
MSREQGVVLFFNERDWNERIAGLCQQADQSFRRQLKAPPGERKEAFRYGLLCEQVRQETVAMRSTRLVVLKDHELRLLDTAGPHHAWLRADELLQHPLGRIPTVATAMEDGLVALEVRNPLARGRTAAPSVDGEELPPAPTWRPEGSDEDAPPPKLRARDAQRQLWEGQLRRAAAGEDIPLVPSNITNEVLTTGLRTYVMGEPDTRVRARVVYRDGSEAQAFPLCGLQLRDDVPPERRVLRFALMSMRHPDMDCRVDGALLRNRLVSQTRPAAETDAAVYELAAKKLKTVVGAGPTALWVYQTGLQSAVVGFYRAVTDHLQRSPGTLTVIPCFWRGADKFEEGTPWTS